MGKVIEAIYEKVFKPLEKFDLKEREGVRIRIEKREIYNIKEYRKYFEDIEEV